MTGSTVALFQRSRLISALVALVVSVGVLAAVTMPRQEDPAFYDRYALVVVPWPGADPLHVERLVVQPLEDALSGVPEIKEIITESRSSEALVHLVLRDTIYDTEPTWNKVREAVRFIQPTLPPQAGPITVRTDTGDPASVVLLVTGSPDLLRLRRVARDLQDELIQVPGLARIERVADPGEQVSVRVEPALADRLSIDATSLAGVLRSRNVVLPSGNLEIGGRRAVLSPHTELLDVEEVRRTPWILPDGSAVPLGELATIDHEPASPALVRLFHDGKPAVGLSLIPDLPRDLVAFGSEIRERIERFNARIDPASGVRVETFAFQPDEVRSRLGSLGGALLSGVFIVATVLFLTMGPRLGLVVSSIVPLVAFSTIAIYASGGGVLHQVSVAALVLALGLIVDNAIVVAETVQRHLDDGRTGTEAAAQAVQELALPLGTATGTTVAAFLPMLLSSGVTADFTRGIPVLLILALVLSYGFALWVTPMLSSWWLRPAASPTRTAGGFKDALAAAVVRRPGVALLAVGSVLAVALACAPFVDRQFFPVSDRPVMLVAVALPEGSHLNATLGVVDELDASIRELDGVRHTTAFVGEGVPRFYYNLRSAGKNPHAATIAVRAERREDLPRLVEQIRRLGARWPEAKVIPRRLQQGPPVGAPVQVRLSGSSLADLEGAAEIAIRELREVDGLRHVRSSLGLGIPRLTWTIDDAAAGRRGLARQDVTVSLLASTNGLAAGVLRGSRDPVPLVIRSPEGERMSVGKANATTISARGARETPLAAVADDQMAWGPATIVRRDRARTVTVSAELAYGSVPALDRVVDRLKANVPSSVTVTLGGERKGSSDANEALFRAMPLGLGLLLVLLLMEFDSFRRLGIVLVTVPLAAAGVLPGLLLGGQPFGFMSLLGVIALVGIVVNNAIVLIDLIEVRRGRGDSVPDAVSAAIRQRLRPILLTTCTTVAGMLPLALSSSPLWPPLAWAIISGLVASTVLTLIAVPALYCVLFAAEGIRPPAMATAIAGFVMVASIVPGVAGAVTLEEAMAEGAVSPVVRAAFADAEGVLAKRRTAFREALAPRVVADAAVVQRDETVALEIEPLEGLNVQIPLFPEQRATASARVVQPLLLPSRLGQGFSAGALARAADANARRARRVGALNAADAWLAVHEVRANQQATAALVASLTSLESSVRARHEAQLLVQSDLLRVQVALLEARQQAAELDVQLRLAKLALGRAMGRTERVEPSLELPPLDLPPEVRPLRERHDIQALEDQIDAARWRRRALRLDALPNVQAFASYNVLVQDNVVDNDWLEVGLQVSWTPLAGGARQSRIAAVNSQVTSLKAQLEDLELAVELDRAGSRATLELARAEVVVREQAVAQAEAVKRQLTARYDVGSTTLSDLLEAEADLAAQLAKASRARIAVTRARLAYREAHGLPVIEDS